MGSHEFRAALKPQRAPAPPNGNILNFFAKDAFTLSSILLGGALLQIVLIAVLPSKYALLPAIVALLWTIVSTVMRSVSPATNDYLSDVIPGRVSAQLPSGNGSFGNKPSAHPVVVLNIGVRFNHPLGVLAPGARETAQLFLAMTEQLRERREEFGLLGFSDWRANERSAQNTLLDIFYFRDLEGLHAFAHDKLHREAWNFYNDLIKKKGYKHIGVFHEVFCAAPGSYETIYLNMPPLLMGATDVKVKNEETGEDEWVKPLVDADVPSLRSQFGRMGKAVEDNPYYPNESMDVF